jgi:hypothetical protein
MKIRNGFVSNSSSSSYLLCLPNKFDILSTGITPEELEAEGISLDEVFGAMAELKGQGYISEESTGYTFLLNKLGLYQVFEFSGGPDSGCIHILSDADKCRVVNLLIADGMVLDPHVGNPSNASP